MSRDDDSKKSSDGLSLADQLADIDVEVSEESEDQEEAARQPPEPEPKSDEELFREALDGMSDQDIQKAKYSGPDEATSEPERRDQSDDNQEEQPAKAVHAEESGDGRMADQLSGLDVEVREAPEEPKEPESEPEPAAEETSPRQQFERALDGLTRTEMRRQKYDLPTAKKKQQSSADGDDDPGSDQQRSTREEQKARKELERRREQRKFEAAMQDVERMETSKKYRQPKHPDPSSYLDEEEGRTADDFVTRRLPKSGEGLNDIAKLDDAQEAMLERFEQWKSNHDFPELNLRGETADDAVVRLRGFIQQCVDQEAAFARIIHGKGKQSNGQPVVKPTVLEWLEEHGAPFIRGYVPERKFGGDYGSLVVEFRR